MKIIQPKNNAPVLTEKPAEIRLLAAGIAHELWSPLSVLKTMIFTMRDGIPPADPRSVDFDVVNEEIDRMEQSIQKFLDYTWPPDPILAPVSLGQVVAIAMNLLAHKAQSQGVEIETDVDMDMMIMADQRQIEHVFTNLALNALREMPEGGKLSIAASTEQVFINLALNALPATSRQKSANAADHEAKALDASSDPSDTERSNAAHEGVGVAVTDTGPGIPKNEIDHIFEPFAIRGMGLGLAIVQQIVERHGGKIEAHNRPEGGAEFTVTLPLMEGR